ncbi:MAG: type I phosphomannose isomerase catalytic subunit, partial [Mucinivorans sp.]
MLYPLKFKPLFKERIWGARRLETSFGKHLPADKPIGESWELSGLEGDVSIVANGNLRGNSLEELTEIYMGDLVGDGVFERFGIEFPLLIKLIDANDNLSIQVHPSDELSAVRHNAWGKTEMWYVLDHEPGASLYLGFNQPVTREKYLEYLNAGRVEELLNKYQVQRGDTYFIPAGTIHAIGAGLLVAEIQQTSDVTYRVYDFNRLDSQGRARELHTELALDAINYSQAHDYLVNKTPEAGKAIGIQSCPYFASSITRVDGSLVRDYALTDSFVVYVCTEGELKIMCDNHSSETIACGQTVLVPAIIDSLVLEG